MKLRSRSSDDRRACSCLTVRLSRKQLQFVFNVHLNWKPPRAHDHQLCSIRIVSCYTEANETGVNIRLDVTVTGGGEEEEERRRRCRRWRRRWRWRWMSRNRQTAACRFEPLRIKDQKLQLRLFTTAAVSQIMTSLLLQLE